MIAFSVATKIEAIAIIEKFKLEKINNNYFNIYKNKNIALIITGIGIIKSAIATTYFIGYLKPENIKSIYNIGIAGCLDKNINLGSIFIIDKIIDTNENKYFYPHISLYNLNKCSISSFSKPVIKSQVNDISSTLVDMEASSFFQVSISMLSSDKIFILKIVSDYLLDDQNEKLSKQKILFYMQNNISIIQDFILD